MLHGRGAEGVGNAGSGDSLVRDHISNGTSGTVASIGGNRDARWTTRGRGDRHRRRWTTLVIRYGRKRSPGCWVEDPPRGSHPVPGRLQLPCRGLGGTGQTSDITVCVLLSTVTAYIGNLRFYRRFAAVYRMEAGMEYMSRPRALVFLSLGTCSVDRRIARDRANAWTDYDSALLRAVVWAKSGLFTRDFLQSWVYHTYLGVP